MYAIQWKALNQMTARSKGEIWVVWKEGVVVCLSSLNTRFTFPKCTCRIHIEKNSYCWIVVNLMSTMSFSAKLLSNGSALQHVLVLGVVPSPVQDFALLLAKLYEVLGPFLPPVEVSLDGSLALWWTSHSPRFCVICLFTESALYHIIQIINEDIKQD